MSQTIDVKVVADVHCDVGEGPCWDEKGERLLFVDVTASKIYSYCPSDGLLTFVQLDRHVGAAIPRTRGGLVAAVQDGIALVDESDGTLQLLAPIESDRADTRMNDAKCDPKGRMFAGTMSYTFEQGAAAFYRIDSDCSVEKILDAATIPNGTGWSPDGQQMYYIESGDFCLYVFDYELSSGRVGNRRPLIEFDRTAGMPDGMTVDEDGYLWVALFGGSRVERFSPAGELTSEVSLPVSQVTSVCFGGEQLSDLYITSAAYELNKRQLNHELFAGATFVCQPGVKGTPSIGFAG